VIAEISGNDQVVCNVTSTFFLSFSKLVNPVDSSAIEKIKGKEIMIKILSKNHREGLRRERERNITQAFYFAEGNR